MINKVNHQLYCVIEHGIKYASANTKKVLAEKKFQLAWFFVYKPYSKLTLFHFFEQRPVIYILN